MKLKSYIAALHAALLCILLAASPAGSGSMTLLGAGGSSVVVTPVNVNAIGSSAIVLPNGTSGTYTNLTIAPGTKIALIVTVVMDVVSPAPTAVTAIWDSGGSNQSMTLLSSSPVSSGTGGIAIVFGLRNPIVGNKTLAISWTNPDFVYVDAIAFNNVSQTSDATAFPVAGQGTTSAAASVTNPATTTITSDTNGYCAAVTNVPSGNSRSSQSDTELFYSTAGSVNNAEAQYGVGAASKTMTLTLANTNGIWSMAVACVAAG